MAIWKELSGKCPEKTKANQQGIRFPKFVEIFLLKFNRPLQFVFYFMATTGHIFLTYIWVYYKTGVVHFPFLALKLFFLVYLLSLLRWVSMKLPGPTGEQQNPGYIGAVHFY